MIDYILGEASKRMQGSIKIHHPLQEVIRPNADEHKPKVQYCPVHACVEVGSAKSKARPFPAPRSYLPVMS